MIKDNNRLSQNFRKTIMIAGFLLLLANLWRVNYGHIFSRENLGEALGILSNSLLIAAMVVSLRYTKRKIRE